MAAAAAAAVAVVAATVAIIPELQPCPWRVDPFVWLVATLLPMLLALVGGTSVA